MEVNACFTFYPNACFDQLFQIRLDMSFVSTLFDSLGALAPAPTHSKLPLTFEALNQVLQ